jgi:hypothetical protein
MYFKELPAIEVGKEDLPYPQMIRSAFDKHELCGAVKFIPKNNDVSLFSGYKPSVSLNYFIYIFNDHEFFLSIMSKSLLITE